MPYKPSKSGGRKERREEKLRGRDKEIIRGRESNKRNKVEEMRGRGRKKTAEGHLDS